MTNDDHTPTMLKKRLIRIDGHWPSYADQPAWSGLARIINLDHTDPVRVRVIQIDRPQTGSVGMLAHNPNIDWHPKPGDVLIRRVILRGSGDTHLTDWKQSKPTARPTATET